MKEVGGFFELELYDRGSLYHDQAIALNSARNAFEYYLLANNITKMHLPYFMCHVMLQPLIKHRIEHEFYEIDDNFEICSNVKLKKHESLLYVNYFDLKDSYINKLVREYGVEKLLIDCTHSFFYRPTKNLQTIYSARKFFGVPDGAFLYSKNRISKKLSRGKSHQNMTHLLGRSDVNGAEFYEEYKKNDLNIGLYTLEEMSNLTQKILRSLDYQRIQEKRINNFTFLHNKLSYMNQFVINKKGSFIYPFLIKNGENLRKMLIEKRIYVPIYWPELIALDDKYINKKMVVDLVCLPIDQRYDESNMQYIVDMIKKSLCSENEF